MEICQAFKHLLFWTSVSFQTCSHYRNCCQRRVWVFLPQTNESSEPSTCAFLRSLFSPMFGIFGGNCWISLEDVCFNVSPIKTWYRMGSIPFHHPTEADPFVQQAVAKVGKLRQLGSSKKKSRKIWVFPKIGVPQNGWFMINGKPYLKGWFGGTTIFGNIHIADLRWCFFLCNVYCVFFSQD